MRIEHVEHIRAPLGQVWEVTVDVESLPTVTPTMTRVERLDEGPLGVGSEIRIKQPGQRERAWTVTEFEPEQRFAWSTRAMGMTMTGRHEVRPSDGGTSNTLSIDLVGTLAPVLGPLLRRPIAKALATENRGFKTAIEAEAGRAGR